jgi:hypothetical protein
MEWKIVKLIKKKKKSRNKFKSKSKNKNKYKAVKKIPNLI